MEGLFPCGFYLYFKYRGKKKPVKSSFIDLVHHLSQPPPPPPHTHKSRFFAQITSYYPLFSKDKKAITYRTFLKKQTLLSRPKNYSIIRYDL